MDSDLWWLYSDTHLSKASPLKYLELFLQKSSPNTKQNFVVLDQGRQLYRNPTVVNLFCKYKYEVFHTGADFSFQNGHVERAHCTIATSTKALFFGAALLVKFWPYAFNHAIQIRNALPYRDQAAAPILLVTGKKVNFINLRTFGCWMWVCPTGICKKRFKEDSQKGIFLDYTSYG